MTKHMTRRLREELERQEKITKEMKQKADESFNSWVKDVIIEQEKKKKKVVKVDGRRK